MISRLWCRDDDEVIESLECGILFSLDIDRSERGTQSITELVSEV